MIETKQDNDLLEESWHLNALVLTKSTILFENHCHGRRDRVLRAFIALGDWWQKT